MAFVGVQAQMMICPKIVNGKAHNPSTIHWWLDVPGSPTAPVAPVAYRVDHFDAVGIVHAEEVSGRSKQRILFLAFHPF